MSRNIETIITFNRTSEIILISFFFTMKIGSKMHSRCFGLMGGHENFVFNLLVKLSVELDFSKIEVINSANV
jgi:hypothetical protein